MDLNININIDWKEANRLADKLLKGFMNMGSLLSGQEVKQQNDVITLVEDLSKTLKEEIKVDNDLGYSAEEVRKALGDLMKSEGKEAAKSILKKFNATKFTDVSEEQYSALMKEIKAVK